MKIVFAGWNYGGNTSEVDHLERAQIATQLGLSVLVTFGWPESTRKQINMIRDAEAGRLVFAAWEGAHGTDTATRKEKSDLTYDKGLANLMSFADRNTENQLNTMREVRAEKPHPRSRIFLDSGAFSVHSRGGFINMDAYCAFIAEYKDMVDYYFNLDVIPENKGPDAIAKAVEGGLQNWKTMQARGLSPIHTFHYGEPVEVLRQIVDRALSTMAKPYIAIGGAARVPSLARHEWLQNLVWPELVDAKGKPKLKVHGLAITNLRSLWAFPWASADSTSWLVSSYNGEIAYWRDGELNWFKASDRHRQGWQGYTDAEKACIEEMLGQDGQDFATLPYRAQMTIFVRHNITQLLKAEAKIPATLPETSKGRRKLFG